MLYCQSYMYQKRKTSCAPTYCKSALFKKNQTATPSVQPITRECWFGILVILQSDCAGIRPVWLEINDHVMGSA
ncbi:hypothetical protein CRE_01331 [Caenorhabditis remanei]|uniref:Uncharacterized protein n=1 Tax=Caenorhabditis remanei TaxID=31234 RepID=E3N9R1_CAERE|nr:hypothetical protein CRE_01331 [Caenorhabditis remanei]